MQADKRKRPPESGNFTGGQTKQLNSILADYFGVVKENMKHLGDITKINGALAPPVNVVIGGFPLIWETLNGEHTCLWASEIEEFPLAVTRFHFKEHK